VRDPQRKGRFVVLEGIDGAGKSEQAARLCAWLDERGDRVVATREPTDGAFGRRYRAWARGDLEAEPDEVLDLFLRDRREHVRELIAPELKRGAVVVCDRYVHSTLAYQVAHGNDREHVTALMQREGFPEPDLVLWLRLPVTTALERLGSAATERFERAAFLARVDAEYARLGLEEVDASGTVDEVAALVRARVAKLLQDR
jgi:dTMP kinase